MFANRLRQLRENQGLRQKEAAKKLGLSQVTYNRYEQGEREPDLNTIVKIADFYNVSVDQLLGRKDLYTLKNKDIENISPDIINYSVRVLVDGLDKYYETLKKVRPEISKDELFEQSFSYLKNFNNLKRSEQLEFISTLSSHVERKDKSSQSIHYTGKEISNNDIYKKLKNLSPEHQKAVKLLLGIDKEL